MNNKKLGTSFEREVCEILRKRGWWAHFITPDVRGAQPFDIIAVRDNEGMAVECKTLSDKQTKFSISRLEENQKFALDYFRKECGNTNAFICIKWRGEIYVVKWLELKYKEVIDLSSGEVQKFD